MSRQQRTRICGGHRLSRDIPKPCPPDCRHSESENRSSKPKDARVENDWLFVREILLEKSEHEKPTFATNETHTRCL